MEKTRLVAFVFVASVCIMLSGCEKSNHGAGHGHDFGDNNPDVYVAIGDSITRGYGATTSWPSELSVKLGKKVVNRGVDGARTSYGVEVINSVLRQYKPGYVLILLGHNDIIHGNTPQSVKELLRHIVSAAKENKSVVVIGTLVPMSLGHSIYDGGGEALSNEIKKLASEEQIKYVDIRNAFLGKDTWIDRDGLHPNNEGQRQIAYTFLDVL